MMHLPKQMNVKMDWLLKYNKQQCPYLKTNKNNSLMKKRKSLIKKHDALEQEVYNELRKRIAKSKYESKHIDGKVLKVNIFGYTELAVINDRLTFLDDGGLHYSIDNGDCTLLDLIELL